MALSLNSAMYVGESMQAIVRRRAETDSPEGLEDHDNKDLMLSTDENPLIGKDF